MSRSPSASDYKLQDEELSPTVQGLSKRPGHAPSVPAKFADESFKLFASIGPVEDSTPEEARRIKRRATLIVLPFLCVGYHLMSVREFETPKAVTDSAAQVPRQANRALPPLFLLP